MDEVPLTFSDAEVEGLLRYAQANAFMMWDIARENAEGGNLLAASL